MLSTVLCQPPEIVVNVSEDPTVVSARLSSDQYPVPAPRSGGLFIMNGLASKPDNVRIIRINGRSEDMKENRPFNRSYEVIMSPPVTS